jgi:hypothetical protein
MAEKAPFKKSGGLWHSPPKEKDLNNPDVPVHKRPTLEWREVKEWRETMLVIGQQRGRSAAFFLLCGGGGAGTDSYPMFMSDATEMMKTATIVQGTVTGRWTIVKKGQNYGLKYLGE